MIQQSLSVLRAGTAEGNAKVFYGSNSEFSSICANALGRNVPYGRLGVRFTLESIANPCLTPLGPIVTSDLPARQFGSYPLTEDVMCRHQGLPDHLPLI